MYDDDDDYDDESYSWTYSIYKYIYDECMDRHINAHKNIPIGYIDLWYTVVLTITFGTEKEGPGYVDTP